jgi:hypothetical protein
MAKVIKQGRVKTIIAEYECRICDSVIEFCKSDIQSDQRDGDYVTCPVCACLISSRILKWTKR